jgi:hypothetical protein
MARYSLRRFGVSAAEAEAIAQGLRGRSVAVAGRRSRALPDALGWLRAWLSGRRA